MADAINIAVAGRPAEEFAERAPRRSIRAATRPPLLSIVIVTWNSERWIDRCLESIPAACEGISHEVIVYDNASEDATMRHLETSEARIIESQNNAGFAAGVNRAIDHSAGRFVLLLNPDCELSPRCVTELVRYLDSHPEAAAAAPLLANERGDSQREFQLRRFPTLLSLSTEILLIDEFFPANSHIAHYRYRDLDITRPQPVEQPAAAALLVRRETYDEVGPLDERFAPAWFEDVDYCRRIAEAGRSIWIVPTAHARHFGGASLEHVPFARFVDVWYRNMFLYARKWLSPAQSEALRWVIIIGMMLRCIAALAGFAHPEQGRLAAFRAYAAVLGKAFDRWGDSFLSSS
jgi:GT2 family glycosyltransferase